MNDHTILLDIHRGCHQVFARLLDHLESLSGVELHKELEGFGVPTIQLQVHHVIAAERYWFGVLQEKILVDEDQDRYPDVAALKSLREQVAGRSLEILAEASPGFLTTPVQRMTWGDKLKTLVPAHVVTRTQTHYFHHQGQILAMCRLLGKPGGGLDFPLE